MKTTILKKDEIDRKWYIIDATDKTLGKIATKVADKLRGKDKACFTPHMDCGDFVVITNSAKVKLTGKKMDDKMYYRHSGFPGGLRSFSAKEMLAKDATSIIELAVKGMLPKNKLRKEFMKKLKIYAGEEHPHSAQNPVELDI